MVGIVGAVSSFGDRAIHWRRQSGSGVPIVLVNGCWLAAEHWHEVVDLLPERTVVRFDRPGMGGTRWPEQLPTLAAEVASLRDLILELGTPVVLVGHSMASFHVEAVARMYPQLVSGLVLVDGSVEFLAEEPPLPSTRLPRLIRAVSRIPPLHLAGAVVHRAEAMWQSVRLDLRHDWDPRIAELYTDPETAAMGTGESIAYLHQGWELLGVRAEHPWPGVPTVLLTAMEQTAERDWVARQARLARLLDARQELVEGSDHLMMIDRPDAVVAAIDEVTAQVAHR